jgi:hypothetical protein
LPGPDFHRGFLKRHPQLSERVANLVKRSRAALSHDQVNDFFDRVEKAAENVLPENFWNYDETNLREHAGAKKAFVQKGVKYAEQVRDHSNSSISIMFCGSAAGQLLPPYVVYKESDVNIFFLNKKN